METSLTVTLTSGGGAGALGPRGRLTITLARERLGGGMDGPLLCHDHLPAPASLRAGGGRILLTLYVDDGRTFDSNAVECDAFLVRLANHFARTGGREDPFFPSLKIISVEDVDTAGTEETAYLGFLEQRYRTREVKNGLNEALQET